MLMANNIEDILGDKEKSIYWLGQQVGVSYNTIYRIVKAERIPPGTRFGTLRRIAETLGVSVDELED